MAIAEMTAGSMPSPGPTTDPAKVGKWEVAPNQFRNIPVHMALLHTSNVLAFGGRGKRSGQFR